MKIILIYYFWTLILSNLASAASANYGGCDLQPLQCDDSILAEERAHSASCEILMDAVYDLEMSGSAATNNPEERTSILQSQRHREPNSRKPERNRIVRRKRDQATTAATSIDQPYTPPFLPSANMTPYENQVRLQVCKSLLQMPGIRRRCCTTLWVTCPEYGPDSTNVPPELPVAPGAPDGSNGPSIFEISSQSNSNSNSPAQSILSGLANSLMSAAKNFLNGQLQKQPVQWAGDTQG